MDINIPEGLVKEFMIVHCITDHDRVKDLLKAVVMSAILCDCICHQLETTH